MAESVGRQSAAVREQFVFEAERAQVGDPHRIEDAVEMIRLVLDDARMEACHGAVDRPAVQVEAAVAQFRVPSDYACLLYTSPSPRDRTRSRMPSSA